jgi:hypothetical protein
MTRRRSLNLRERAVAPVWLVRAAGRWRSRFIYQCGLRAEVVSALLRNRERSGQGEGQATSLSSRRNSGSCFLLGHHSRHSLPAITDGM